MDLDWLVVLYFHIGLQHFASGQYLIIGLVSTSGIQRLARLLDHVRLDILLK